MKNNQTIINESRKETFILRKSKKRWKYVGSIF